MSAANLDRETALKIALAARVLPEVSVGQLLEVLATRIKGDINEKTLTSITVTDLKNAFSNSEGDASSGVALPELKQAVRILWGEYDVESLPKIQTLSEIPERSVRVAVASNTGEKLDGHFGSCVRFLIYQLSEDSIQLVDIRSAMDADLSEDKNAFRVDLIADCQVLFVVSIGGPAAAKVVRAGLYPIKKARGGEAKDILAELQEVMRHSPPPWLAKHLGDDAEHRVRFERESIA